MTIPSAAPNVRVISQTSPESLRTETLEQLTCRFCECTRKPLCNHLIALAACLRRVRRLASAVTISRIDYDFGVVAVVRRGRFPHTGEGRAIGFIPSGLPS